jgi:hypothetical protein
MTPDDIKKAREIIDAATPGPWKDISNNRDIDAMVIWSTGPEDALKHNCVPPDGIECTLADSIFICAARTMWPEALDMVEAQQRVITKLCETNEMVEAVRNDLSEQLKYIKSYYGDK